MVSSVSWGKQHIGLREILVPLWEESRCATKAWQPAETTALPMQEDSRVVGNPSQTDQNSTAQPTAALALRMVRAGKAQRQSCPWRRAEDEETNNSPWAARAVKRQCPPSLPLRHHTHTHTHHLLATPAEAHCVRKKEGVAVVNQTPPCDWSYH